MFLPTDVTSEAIAHFVGEFEVHAEDIRFHRSFDGFSQHETPPAPPLDAPPRPGITVTADDLHSRQGRLSGPHGEAPEDAAAVLRSSPARGFEPLHGPIEVGRPYVLDTQPWPNAFGFADGSFGPVIGPEPGSFGQILLQVQFLSDNDKITLGEAPPDVAFAPFDSGWTLRPGGVGASNHRAS